MRNAFSGYIALSEALTPDQRISESAGEEQFTAKGPGLCGSLYYSFMMKLRVPVHSVLVQILTCTDNRHKQLWVTRVLGIIFHPGTELSLPSSEKDDPENKCQ